MAQEFPAWSFATKSNAVYYALGAQADSVIMDAVHRGATSLAAMLTALAECQVFSVMLPSLFLSWQGCYVR